MDRPLIDYPNLEYLPREGIQTAGNNAWATRSLFLETAKPEHEEQAMWCLSEHEVFAHDKWYPSAWMVYIHAADEYDALRKICGNVKQWEHIKKFLDKWRKGMFEMWCAEQAFLQRSVLKQVLLTGAKAGDPGYVSAVKTLLQMIDGPKKVGRPKKEKEQPKDDQGDSARVLKFRE